MEGNVYDFFLESNRTNEKDVRKGIVIVEAFAQKFCRILTTDEESRATTCSLIVSAAFPRGTREIIFPSTYTRARARWWNVRKCAARSSLHARTEFISSLFDCAQPAVGNCHSRQRTRRPFIVPTNYSDRNLFLSDKISDRMRFSLFLENVDHRRVPSSHFTKLSSVVRNVR